MQLRGGETQEGVRNVQRARAQAGREGILGCPSRCWQAALCGHAGVWFVLYTHRAAAGHLIVISDGTGRRRGCDERGARISMRLAVGQSLARSVPVRGHLGPASSAVTASSFPGGCSVDAH